jgi:hypothetical protein
MQIGGPIFRTGERRKKRAGPARDRPRTEPKLGLPLDQARWGRPLLAAPPGFCFCRRDRRAGRFGPEVAGNDLSRGRLGRGGAGRGRRSGDGSGGFRIHGDLSGMAGHFLGARGGSAWARGDVTPSGSFHPRKSWRLSRIVCAQELAGVAVPFSRRRVRGGARCRLSLAIGGRSGFRLWSRPNADSLSHARCFRPVHLHPTDQRIPGAPCCGRRNAAVPPDIP